MTNWFTFLLGVAIVIFTGGSVVRTLVMTRQARSRLTLPVDTLIRRLVATIARRFHNYLRRDTIQSWAAPQMIVGALATWLISFLIGYTLMLHGAVGLQLDASFREAGSSLFTLGFASSDRDQLSIIDFIAAATGPITIGLMISYLPTLYSSFNRREVEVALLKSRAGEPNWGPEILARFAALGSDPKRLTELWNTWERWAADVSESHTTYSVLIYTRSARPMRNWLIALLSVMDAAALSLVLRPNDRQVASRMLLRQGIECIRDLAVVTHIKYEAEPATGTPIQLTEEEFIEAVDMLVASGYELQQDAEAAWPFFSDWRMMYEPIFYELAKRIDAVPAKWSGPRVPPTKPIPPYRPRYVIDNADGSLSFPNSVRKPPILPPSKRLG